MKKMKIKTIVYMIKSVLSIDISDITKYLSDNGVCMLKSNNSYCMIDIYNISYDEVIDKLILKVHKLIEKCTNSDKINSKLSIDEVKSYVTKDTIKFFFDISVDNDEKTLIIEKQ